jgi:GMP synthase-like glutamine amidotransferase
MMRVLVFQHIGVEHPGIFRDFLAADGGAWDAVELDAGEPIPSFDGPAFDKYDALWVMGGPMDVWQEDRHPWLVQEKAVIREAVAERRMPFFGLCLGHQLLADALGGSVGLAGTPEIGVMDVSLTDAGLASPFLAGLPARGPALQWHGAEVTRAPEGAVVLAESPACAVQAMQVGAHAFSVQYHVEITDSTAADWAAIPEYRAALERALGPAGLTRIEEDCRRHMPGFNAAARTLYRNLMTHLTVA